MEGQKEGGDGVMAGIFAVDRCVCPLRIVSVESCIMYHASNGQATVVMEG